MSVIQFANSLYAKIQYQMLLFFWILTLFLLFSCHSDDQIPDLKAVEASLAEKVRLGESNTPPNRLSQNEIEARIDQAIKIPELKNWALILRARNLLKSTNSSDSEIAKAVAALKKISDQSPAFLYASLLRIQVGLSKNTPEIGKLERDLSLLESQIDQKSLEDLFSEVLLTKGMLLEKKNDHRGALSLYHRIRLNYSGTDIASQAYIRSTNLTDGSNSPLISLSLADQLGEASLLVSEQRREKAYNLLQEALGQVQKNTPAYYEIREAEYRFLEGTGRIKEALLLLNEIIKEAPSQIAAKAAFQKISSYFAKEQYKKALKLIQIFKNDFHQHAYHSEIIYLEAKILARRSLYPDSNALLKEIISRTNSLALVLKSHRLLAWNYLKIGNYQASEEHFSNLMQKTAELLQLMQFNTSQEFFLDHYLPESYKVKFRSKTLLAPDDILEQLQSEIFELRAHGLYWKTQLRKLAEANTDDTNDLLQSLSLNNSLNYYTETLKADPVSTSCPLTAVAQSDESIQASLSRLKQAGLVYAMESEAWWHYSNSKNNHPLFPLQVASSLKKTGAPASARKILLKILPPWKYNSIASENSAHNREELQGCTVEYKKILINFEETGYQNEATNLRKDSSSLELDSLKLAIIRDYIDSSNNFSRAAISEVTDKINTLSKHHTNTEELLLAYLKGPTWLQKEPAFLRSSEMPKNFPSSAWIELITDEQLLKRVKKILLYQAWYKELS